jgi:hypothetical protein
MVDAELLYTTIRQRTCHSKKKKKKPRLPGISMCRHENHHMHVRNFCNLKHAIMRRAFIVDDVDFSPPSIKDR